MRRFRVYFINIVSGLAAATAVLWISSRIEQQRASEFMEKLRATPPSLPPNFEGGGYVMGASFGPGIFTWFVAILAFTLVFVALARWQGRSNPSVGTDRYQKLF